MGVASRWTHCRCFVVLLVTLHELRLKETKMLSAVATVRKSTFAKSNQILGAGKLLDYSDGDSKSSEKKNDDYSQFQCILWSRLKSTPP